MDIAIYILSRLIITFALYNHDPSLAIAAVSYYLYEVYNTVNRYYKFKQAINESMVFISKKKDQSDKASTNVKDVTDEKEQ